MKVSSEDRQTEHDSKRAAEYKSSSHTNNRNNGSASIYIKINALIYLLVGIIIQMIFNDLSLNAIYIKCFLSRTSNIIIFSINIIKHTRITLIINMHWDKVTSNDDNNIITRI